MSKSEQGSIPVGPLPPPTALSGAAFLPTLPGHLSLTPEQRIWLYSDVQWEEFVLEWATTLESSYVQVVRGGGTGDHGVDIAGFASEKGFDGQWDCYQCKQYSSALVRSSAYPEMLKIVLGTMANHYTWPRKYRFAAPKGYGPSLVSVIHSPTKLKSGFRAELTKPKSGLAKGLETASVEEVLAFIDYADFSIFGTVELHELVTAHAGTRWHAARFGVPLPPRPAVPEPSATPEHDEQRYIEKLVSAYCERHPELMTPGSDISQHAKVGKHYDRQRVSFYSAEALRVFARDAVPEGTFESLQEEVFDGVADVHDLPYADGMTRLTQVTLTANSLSMTANGLLPVLGMRDRAGICHQLANDDRLTWCDADSE